MPLFAAPNAIAFPSAPLAVLLLLFAVEFVGGEMAAAAAAALLLLLLLDIGDSPCEEEDGAGATAGACWAAETGRGGGRKGACGLGQEGAPRFARRAIGSSPPAAAPAPELLRKEPGVYKREKKLGKP